MDFDDLDYCPHSATFYQHGWHGLPVKGCGGSHLDEQEARRLAKPFGPHDEKQPTYYDYLSHSVVLLSNWEEREC